jgi:glycyl-tRNA synthetase beta chain
MNKTQDFLVEIGTEELPPKDLKNLAIHFGQNIAGYLNDAGISYAELKTFATPRRLAAIFTELATQQPEQLISKRGPALSAAYNADGTPTKAALGFAQSCGVTMQEITTQENDKGAWLYFEQTVQGRATKDLLPQMVEKALSNLPVKKYMRWGEGEISFVRPIHWIVMLYGTEVIHANIWGIATDNISYGHRILSPKPIKIKTPSSYNEQLESEGKIIASFETRQAKIITDINALATQHNGSALLDPALLDMVTGLVEHPVALLAEFDAAFLRVPKECLISAMQEHQKCFALLDNTGKLLPKFILISNISSTDPQTVIRGNELVMQARLADAAFYFDKDQQQSLQQRRDALKNILYVKKLGSLFDKTERIKKLAAAIATNEYNKKFHNINIKDLERCAELCKSDLLTSMVYEFPELQGIMGCYYAKHDQEADAVAIGIKEHYLPKFAEDSLPQTDIGIIIALADRIDTLVGMLGIGNFPTGEKDPYGLRRQAIAILRILIEKDIDLPLKQIFSLAKNSGDEFSSNVNAATTATYEFLSDRLKSLFLAKNANPKTIAAVMATVSLDPIVTNPQQEYRPSDIAKRIQAVTEFQALPEAESLAAANKRVQNLLEKSAQDTNVTTSTIQPDLFATNEERDLYQAIQNQETQIVPLEKVKNYSGILKSLATLQAPIDAFFNNVMVMDPNPTMRDNRLNLLKKLRSLFLKVADVSQL